MQRPVHADVLVAVPDALPVGDVDAFRRFLAGSAKADVGPGRGRCASRAASPGSVSIEAMFAERRIPIRSAEWRTAFERIQVAMDLTSRLNVLLFSDINARHAVLSELLEDPHPEKSFVHPLRPRHRIHMRRPQS